MSETWQEVALGEVVQPIGDRSTPSPNTSMPYIGMEHVESQTGRVLPLGRASDITSSSPLVRSGDVLYGRLRPYLNKVAIAPADAYASGEFIVFRGNDAIDPRFLKWRLTAPDFVQYAVSLNTGDRPRVKWPQMASFRLLLPSPGEQQELVACLEDGLSRLDAGIREMEVARLRLERLRAGLVDDLLADVPTVDLAVADVLLPRENGGLMDQGWSPKCLPEPAGNAQWGVLKTTAVQWGRFLPQENKALPETLAPRPRLQVEVGDLLVTRAGPRSRCGVVALVRDVPERLMLCDKMYRMTPNPDLVMPEVLEALLGSHDARLRIETLKTGISDSGLNLTQSRFLSMKITVPVLAAQEEFLRRVNDVAGSCDRLEAASQKTEARASSLRRSLLAAAFSGRLTTDLPAAEATLAV